MIISSILQGLVILAIVLNLGYVEARLGAVLKREQSLRVVDEPSYWSRFLPQLVGYGGTPPDSSLPLQECEGDCDTDDDVSKSSR